MKNQIPIIIFVTVILFAMLYFFTQSPLPAYVDEPPEEETELIDYTPFSDPDFKLSFLIPDGWTPVQSEHDLLYVNSDGARLSLDVEPYIPVFNQIADAQSAQALLSEETILHDFFKLSTYSFYLLSEKEELLIADMYVWDISELYNLRLTFPLQHLETYEEMIEIIMSSLDWQSMDAIPNYLNLYYSDFGTFEFGYPAADSWTAWLDNGIFICENSDSGSTLQASIQASDVTELLVISEIDFIAQMGTSSNTYIRNYSSTAQQFIAETTMKNGSTSILSYYFKLLVDGIIYEFEITCPVVDSADDYELLMECISYFRII